MNLAESMKFVLKTKSQSLFSALVKEDFKHILKDMTGDLISFKPKSTLKEKFYDFKTSLYGSALLVRELPRRLNNGFKIFQQELMDELDRLPDQKQKTKFCMKVLAGLSKFALSSAYNVGLGETKLIAMGKGKKAFGHALTAKLVYKTIQAFIIRFIQEVEKEIVDPVELANLQSFKETIMDDSGNAIDKFFEGVTDPDEKAFIIVDNFKNYILTGSK